MSYRTAADILNEADERRMRRAFFVTALLLEMEAVLAHLQPLGSVPGRDGAIYECGVFTDMGQEWLIVVVETGPGTHPAQSAVTNAHVMFGNFEVQLLVGVGGSRKDEAPLGSVVASSHVYMPYSGKYGPKGFSARPRTFPLDGRLVGLAKKIRRDKTWPSRIKPPLDGTLPDRETYPVNFPPVGVVAPIASVEAVLDDTDSELEALIASQCGDTCVVEMEGYGAVFAASEERTPSIVIRGVSDLCKAKDPERDKALQPIAACHAGAFGFEILSHWGQIYPHGRQDAPHALGSSPVPDPSPRSTETNVVPEPPILEDAPPPGEGQNAGAEEALPQAEDDMADAGRSAEAGHSPEPEHGLQSAIQIDEQEQQQEELDSRPDGSRVGGPLEIGWRPPGPEAFLPSDPPLQPDVILNLDSDISPSDAPRLVQLELTLRDVTGSTTITIVRATHGSLRLFVSDPIGALRRFGRKALGDALAQREGVELLGMIDFRRQGEIDWLSEKITAASAELMAWPRTLPDGQAIERQEMVALVARIEGNVGSTTVVLGDPGSGKSALLSALTDRFVRQGWPVLAIKADLLDPEIKDEHDLQAFLGIDRPPSAALEMIAEFRSVLLVIDQLDALAGYLDLRTGRLSTLLNMVRRLGRLDNVHVVLSARTFEFHHDVRLRAVAAEKLDLQLPALSTVLSILETRGVKAAGWPEDAQKVMRSPQALATYLQLNDPLQSQPFASYQAMLDRLWHERVLDTPRGAELGRLATDIANRMAEEESLWLACPRFDDSIRDVNTLVAAGILTLLDGSLGFSHQTLFDYALARSFARETGRLSAYVLERQTSLFLRPKLWAGLSYLRGVDQAAYHTELEAIWTAPDLRRHLRVLLIDFLGQEQDPTDREALLMEQALRQPNQRWPAFRAVSGSAGWFRRLARTFIAPAMSESEDAAGRVSEVLVRAWPVEADLVMDLMEKRWLPDREFDQYAWLVLQQAGTWTERAVVAGETILQRTDIASGMVDYVMSAIGVEQPQFAIRLVRARLDRELAAALADSAEKAKAPPPPEGADTFAWYMRDDPRRPIKNLLENSRDWDSLQALAEQSPSIVLDGLWPWFMLCLQALAHLSPQRPGYLGYPVSSDVEFRFDDEREHSLPEPALLGAFRGALDTLAKNVPAEFRRWAAQHEALELGPVQRLIAHTMASQPEIYATDALAYLMKDVRRLHLGAITSPISTTRNLIATVSPYWSPEQTAEFEAMLANYDPPPPPDKTDPRQRRGWRRSTRSIWLELMRAIPAHQTSAKGRRRVEEERRVFGDAEFGARFSSGGFIGSIMDATEMAKASDQDIINAFTELPDATGWANPQHFLSGGNIQLAREFATFAKDDPGRARRILDQLDKDRGTRAAGYAVDAMADTVSPAEVLDLLLDVVSRGYDGEEFRQSASRAIEKLANRKAEFPDSIVNLLQSWLTAPIEGPAHDAVSDEVAEQQEIDTAAEEESETEGDAVHRSLIWGYGGISILPGGPYPILESLIRVRLARKESDALVEALSGYLDVHRNAATWQNLVRFIPFLHPTEAAEKAAFVGKLFSKAPGLVGTKEAAHYLANAHWDLPDLVNGLLDAWRTGGRTAREGYGEIVAIAALMQPDLEWPRARLESLIEDSAQGDARVGAAMSAVNLWHDPKRRSSATSILIRCLERGPQEVWTAAFQIFRLIEEFTPDSDTAALLTAFADRLPDAPRLESTFVVERLTSLLPHMADLVYRVAEGLVRLWRDELGDIRTSTAMAAGELADLAVTLHRLGPATRDQGTALFEQLLDLNSYGARETLEELDARFREQPPSLRRRLPRRSARPRTPGRRPTA